MEKYQKNLEKVKITPESSSNNLSKIDNSIQRTAPYDDTETYYLTQNMESRARGLDNAAEKHQREIEEALKIADLSPGSLVIDTCSGSGEHAERMCQEGLKVVSIELAPDLSDTTKKRIEPYGGLAFNTSLQKMKDAVKPIKKLYPWATNGAKAILNLGESQIYLNPKDQLQWFKDCHEILAPGGKLILQYRFKKKAGKHSGRKITARRARDCARRSGEFITRPKYQQKIGERSLSF